MTTAALLRELTALVGEIADGGAGHRPAAELEALRAAALALPALPPTVRQALERARGRAATIEALGRLQVALSTNEALRGRREEEKQ